MSIIKDLRKSKNMSQKELADILFVNQTAVSQWERGITTPNSITLKKLSELFNVSVDTIIGNDFQISEKKYPVIPVLGYVIAGIPMYAESNIIGWEEISEEMDSQGEHFVLLVKGDSMEPYIMMGDKIVIRKQSDIKSGEVGIVLVNGDEATCKKIVKHENGVSLVSYNPAYPPMFYTNEEVIKKPVEVIGKVVEIRRTIK